MEARKALVTAAAVLATATLAGACMRWRSETKCAATDDEADNSAA